MRRIITLMAFFCLVACPATSSTFPLSQISSTKTLSGKDLAKKVASLKFNDLEKMAGRKFTLKEKMALLIIKKRLRHQDDMSSKDGKTALSFGIAAAAFLILGFFIPYVLLGSLAASIVAIVMGSSAARKNPNDRKAHSAKLLGWISLGLIAFVILLVAIIIAGWSW